MEMDGPASATPAPAPPPPVMTSYKPTSRRRERPPAYVEGPSVYCPECGTNYDRREEMCPHCGYRNYDLLAEQLGNPRRARARQLPSVNGALPVLAAFLLPLGILMFCFGLGISEGLNPRRQGFVVGLLMFFAGFLLTVVALIFCLIWLYQAWRAVLERDEEYSPGLMVGLLAVPFFNFYWMFRAVPGMSTALQKELASVAPNRPTGAGFVPGVLACVFMLIPYFQPVSICLFIAWMLIANNALHRLTRIHDRLREEEDAAEPKPERVSLEAR